MISHSMEDVAKLAEKVTVAIVLTTPVTAYPIASSRQRLIELKVKVFCSLLKTIPILTGLTLNAAVYLYCNSSVKEVFTLEKGA